MALKSQYNTFTKPKGCKENIKQQEDISKQHKAIIIIIIIITTLKTFM